MRQVISTALVAVVVSLVTVTAAGVLAQETESRPIEPAAVAKINADRVDGKHAVGARASRTQRAGKLVATNAQGYLPANILQDRPVTQIKITRVESPYTSLAAGGQGYAEADCPTGSIVVGGGFRTATYDINVVDSWAFDSNTWRVVAKAAAASSLAAHAECMTVTGGSITTASKDIKPAGTGAKKR